MIAGKQGGRIINFSSKSGKTGSALMVPYSSAKGAVIAMTPPILVFLFAQRYFVENVASSGIKG